MKDKVETWFLIITVIAAVILVGWLGYSQIKWASQYTTSDAGNYVSMELLSPGIQYPRVKITTTSGEYIITRYPPIITKNEKCRLYRYNDGNRWLQIGEYLYPVL